MGTPETKGTAMGHGGGRIVRVAGMCLLAAGLVGQMATAREGRPIAGPRNWRAAGVPGVVFGEEKRRKGVRNLCWRRSGMRDTRRYCK